jgi:hypothetical protein
MQNLAFLLLTQLALKILAQSNPKLFVMGVKLMGTSASTKIMDALK